MRFVVPVAFLRARLKHFLHVNILYSMPVLKQIFLMDTTEKLALSPPIKKCVFIFFGPFTPREFLSRWFQWCIQINGSSADTKWGCKRVNICRYRNLNYEESATSFVIVAASKRYKFQIICPMTGQGAFFSSHASWKTSFSGYRNA